jgi:hypothetical protein
VSESFRTRKEWVPFAPYATRIVISQLFAVLYPEVVESDCGWTIVALEKRNGKVFSLTAYY